MIIIIVTIDMIIIIRTAPRVAEVRLRTLHGALGPELPELGRFIYIYIYIYIYNCIYIYKERERERDTCCYHKVQLPHGALRDDAVRPRVPEEVGEVGAGPARGAAPAAAHARAARPYGGHRYDTPYYNIIHDMIYHMIRIIL